MRKKNIPVDTELEQEIMEVQDRNSLITNVRQDLTEIKRQAAYEREVVRLNSDMNNLRQISSIDRFMEQALESIALGVGEEGLSAIERVARNLNSPMDWKFFWEGMAKMQQYKSNLGRMDSLDGYGTPNVLNIGMSVKTSDGTEVKTVIQGKINNG